MKLLHKTNDNKYIYSKMVIILKIYDNVTIQKKIMY